jgi:glycosyltransferase involved in cell wall biosynthesis
LVFLNRYYYPDHSATSQMLSDLAFALARRGCAVTVITSRLRYDAPASALPAQETVDGVAIHRVWTSRFGRANLFGRTLDYATFYLSAAWRLWHLVRKGDIVVAKTDPPLLSVVAAPIAGVRRARFVNWVQDLFPEIAQAAGVIGAPGRLLLPLLRWFRDRALRAAEINIVIGERMAEHMCEQGIPSDRIRVIANWQDGALVRPIMHEKNPMRRAWGFNGEFVVGYSGNLGRVHDLATILDAIALLDGSTVLGEDTAASDRQIRFLFIGDGALQGVLREQIAARGLSNVVLQPYQPRRDLSFSLSVADVHLVTLRPEFEGLIVPSKFYGVAAAGRPTLFVGDAHGEIARLIAAYDCGLSVPCGDGAALAAAIERFSHDRARCEAMGYRARAMLEARFDKPLAIAQWVEVLEGLSGESNPIVACPYRASN